MGAASIAIRIQRGARGYRARFAAARCPGLPAHENFLQDRQGQDAILRAVMAEPLVREPGTQIEYSDLGFILLGEIVERLTGIDTRRLRASEYIFAPLGMRNIVQSAAQPSRANRAHRKRYRVPRNDNCRAKCTTRTPGPWAESRATRGFFRRPATWPSSPDDAEWRHLCASAAAASARRSRNSRRVVQLGDSARALDGTSDRAIFDRTIFFGKKLRPHGFTGTSMWIDPEKDLFVVLLTNRVYPSAENDQDPRSPPGLHDAIVEGLASFPSRAAGR